MSENGIGVILPKILKKTIRKHNSIIHLNSSGKIKIKTLKMMVKTKE